MRLKICFFLLSLDFVFFTVLRPHFLKYIISLFSSHKGNIPSTFAWIFPVFGTVDCSLLIQKLEIFFEFLVLVLNGFFYLFNRSSVVSINNLHFTPSSFPFGVIQDSVLGPLLFILYNSKFTKIISSFSLQSQLYAEYSYIFTSFPKYELSSNFFEISSYIGKNFSWSDSMFLKLDPSKLVLIYFSESFQLIESLPSINISSNLSLAFFPPSVMQASPLTSHFLSYHK